MPPKEARQARRTNPNEAKAEPSQGRRTQPKQAHQSQPQSTSNPSLSPAETADSTIKASRLATRSLPGDRPTESDTKSTFLSQPTPTAEPELIPGITRKSPRGQELATFTSTARSPTLSSSAKATSKLFSRATTTLPLPATTLQSPPLIAFATALSPEKIKSPPSVHSSKAEKSLANIQSEVDEDLGESPKGAIDDYHESKPEAISEFVEHQPLDSDRLLAISMSEVPAVIPLQSNCFRMHFSKTIYKYEIVCEPFNVLAKRERRFVEKAFLQELSIEPQR